MFKLMNPWGIAASVVVLGAVAIAPSQDKGTDRGKRSNDSSQSKRTESRPPKAPDRTPDRVQRNDNRNSGGSLGRVDVGRGGDNRNMGGLGRSDWSQRNDSRNDRNPNVLGRPDLGQRNSGSDWNQRNDRNTNVLGRSDLGQRNDSRNDRNSNSGLRRNNGRSLDDVLRGGPDRFGDSERNREGSNPFQRNEARDLNRERQVRQPDVLGRPGADNRFNSDDQGLLRGKPSHSGKVDYKGQVNNIAREGRDRIRVDTLPARPRPSLEVQVRRTERVSLVVDGWRCGYTHYSRDWRDDYFWYPWYSFTPWSFSATFYSPWYWYPQLPPYLNPARCFQVTYWPSMNWVGFSYAWERPRYDDWSDYYRDRRSDLDYAIADLTRAFEQNDRRAAENLVPRNGSVNIYVDGRYSYSLNPDDFFDVFMDAVDNSRTDRYDILKVEANRGSARVLARHSYRDPWGERQTVYHTYFLEEERGRTVIREFGTSNRRDW